MSFAFDLLMFLILLFCVWQGYRKGVFLSLLSILILLIAAGISGRVASGYAEPLSDKLQPILSWVVDDAIDTATRGKGALEEITDNTVLTEVVKNTYRSIGINEKEIKKMTEVTFSTLTKNSDMTLRDSISKTLLFSIAHMFVGLFAFIILTLLITLLLHFVASIFKLPVFPSIDKIGGPVCGFLYGIMILGVIGWAVRFVGFAVTPEMVSKTILLQLFTKFSILAGVLSF